MIQFGITSGRRIIKLNDGFIGYMLNQPITKEQANQGAIWGRKGSFDFAAFSDGNKVRFNMTPVFDIPLNVPQTLYFVRSNGVIGSVSLFNRDKIIPNATNGTQFNAEPFGSLRISGGILQPDLTGSSVTDVRIGSVTFTLTQEQVDSQKFPFVIENRVKIATDFLKAFGNNTFMPIDQRNFAKQALEDFNRNDISLAVIESIVETLKPYLSEPPLPPPIIPPEQDIPPEEIIPDQGLSTNQKIGIATFIIVAVGLSAYVGLRKSKN